MFWVFHLAAVAEEMASGTSMCAPAGSVGLLSEQGMAGE